MSRKDYEAIAEQFRTEREVGGEAPTLDRLAYRIADVLAQDNERFNRARFLAACGVADASNSY